MSKKVLIIGANGFIGRRTLEYFSSNKDYSVSALSFHKDIGLGDNYKFIESDIRNENSLLNVFNSAKPDLVINCSALSVPDYCETHKEEALEINTKAVEKIVNLCNLFSTRFIHLSTDFVFNGKTHRLYKEEDKPDPVNYYGYTKQLAEQLICNQSNNYAIMRVIVVYGIYLRGQHGNIFNLVKQKLSAGESITVVNDQWRTPTYVSDIIDAINILSDINGRSIYHIGGPECLSISDIAFRVATYLKLDSSLIIPVSTDKMKDSTPRPGFSGLNIEKAKSEFGYNPLNIEDGMKRMFGNHE
jgi:dTDP-4-dehydrorhamnose reductase